jgi:hypothetical protein
MLKEIEYEYVNVLGVKFKFYKPVIEDIVGRRFNYINVEDNGNTVRLGNDKEEFSFYDYNLTESLCAFIESIDSRITEVGMKSSSNHELENGVFTEVVMSWAEHGARWGGNKSISLSWASDNVKLTYVSKETK